ncbi:hypothetical protein NL676_002360 [Syzygium grande]|nr:hypothetical protein NL676_002360 [Syzygium grande]
MVFIDRILKEGNCAIHAQIPAPSLRVSLPPIFVAAVVEFSLLASSSPAPPSHRLPWPRLASSVSFSPCR